MTANDEMDSMTATSFCCGRSSLHSASPNPCTLHSGRSSATMRSASIDSTSLGESEWGCALLEQAPGNVSAGEFLVLAPSASGERSWIANDSPLDQRRVRAGAVFTAHRLRFDGGTALADSHDPILFAGTPAGPTTVFVDAGMPPVSFSSYPRANDPAGPELPRCDPQLQLPHNLMLFDSSFLTVWE